MLLPVLDSGRRSSEGCDLSMIRSRFLIMKICLVKDLVLSFRFSFSLVACLLVHPFRSAKFSIVCLVLIRVYGI